MQEYVRSPLLQWPLVNRVKQDSFELPAASVKWREVILL
jgi:hypothetical protein